MKEIDFEKFPIYEFKPLPETEKVHDLVRYDAETDTFVPYDGEHSRAFASSWKQTYWYVPPRYRENILWSWCKNHQWRAKLKEHPQTEGNAWHYMLRDGETKWGTGKWPRYKHPNKIEYDDLRRFGVKNVGNGRHVKFHIMDPYILRGLLRREDTKEVVEFPEIFVCMYCGEREWKKEDIRWQQWIREGKVSPPITYVTLPGFGRINI